MIWHEFQFIAPLEAVKSNFSGTPTTPKIGLDKKEDCVKVFSCSILACLCVGKHFLGRRHDLNKII